MKQSLAGRVAIVTGASKGLGRALVEALVAEGVRVALFARVSRALDETAERYGDAVLACPCDVRSPETVRAAVERAAARLGRIDILINNAATCLVNKIETIPDADLRAEIETNVYGPIWCARAVIPHLRAAGGGEIVNISSESVSAPVPFMTTYAATKAAIEAFSAGLRNEIKEFGIRVTVVRSGAMVTSITDQWSENQKQAFFAAYARSGRLAESGASIDPAITANTVVDVLRLPSEAGIRLVELGGR
jgi:meso-butanediol dehydrogenase/(S,S)-butanediol dehydrogenase/diacetyl reductase